MTNSYSLEDKDSLKDILNFEKLLSTLYKDASIESLTPGIRQNFKDMLNTTLDLEFSISTFLSSIGLNPIDEISKDLINISKNSFPSSPLNI